MGEPSTSSAFDRLMAERDALPEHVRTEIVQGALRTLPRPGGPHARSASKLGSLLGGPFDFDSDGPGGWVILGEVDVRFGDEVRIPDLVGWTAGRYEEPSSGPFLVVPDWICEVLSPSTARHDRAEKMPLYAQHGVQWLWFVDPELRTVETYRRQGNLWLALRTFAGDVAARAEPFDAVELELGRLWRLPGD